MVYFLYPDKKEAEKIEELDRIIEILSKKPSPEQRRYMRLARGMTKSMFLVARSGSAERKERLEKGKKIRIVSESPESKGVVLPGEEPFRLPPPPPPPPGVDLKEITYPLINVIIRNKKINLANVTVKQGEKGMFYELSESPLSDVDKQIINRTRLLAIEDIKKDSEILEKKDYLEAKLSKVCKEMGLPVSEEYVAKLKYSLTKNILGMGIVDPLLMDKSVTSVQCDNFNEVSIVRSGERMLTNIRFASEEDMRSYITQIANKFSKRLTTENPIETIDYKEIKIQLSISPLKFGFAKV